MKFLEWLDKKILDFQNISDAMLGRTDQEEDDKRNVISVIERLEQLKSFYKLYEKEYFEINKEKEEIF